MKTLVIDADVSIRLKNCLLAAKIKYLEDAANYSVKELLSYRNFGKKSLYELEEWLENKGLSYKPEPERRTYAKLEKKLNLALDALREISKGEGEFNMEPIMHAANTIENMKSIAINAIKLIEE